MAETIEYSEKIKCIEKNILSYIFKKNGFKEDEFTNKIHFKISDSLKEDWGNLISKDEIEKVLSDLIDKKYVDRSDDNTLKVYSSGLKYALMNDYISKADIIDYCNLLNSLHMDLDLAQFKNLQQLSKELSEQKDVVEEKISNVNDKISNFYNNIISILALLIAAFSIIGFNIGGIKFIVTNSEVLPVWQYVVSIGVVNLCIIVSLFFVFYLVQKIINPNRSLFGRITKKENVELKVRLLNNKTFQVFIIICNILMFLSIAIYYSYPIMIKMIFKK